MSAPSAASRPASSPTPALDALLSEAALGPLIRRARWLDTLARHLHPCLPAPLNAHARLTNIQDEALVYLVDSPVWHARLRLSTETLLAAARKIGLEVNTVRIRIARQAFDPHARAMTEIDTRMQRENGTTPAEGTALAQMCALLDDRPVQAP